MLRNELSRLLRDGDQFFPGRNLNHFPFFAARKMRRFSRGIFTRNQSSTREILRGERLTPRPVIAGSLQGNSVKDKGMDRRRNGWAQEKRLRGTRRERAEGARGHRSINQDNERQVEAR